MGENHFFPKPKSVRKYEEDDADDGERGDSKAAVMEMNQFASNSHCHYFNSFDLSNQNEVLRCQ